MLPGIFQTRQPANRGWGYLALLLVVPLCLHASVFPAGRVMAEEYSTDSVCITEAVENSVRLLQSHMSAGPSPERTGLSKSNAATRRVTGECFLHLIGAGIYMRC